MCSRALIIQLLNLKIYSLYNFKEVFYITIYGHLEKLTFSDFFEMLTSCNSLYYRELQHRIFKVTSKNCSF